MTKTRALGFLSVLPLYLAMATAVGFVDHHVRPFPEHAYTNYVPEVTSFAAQPPARYRILAPFAYTQWQRLTGRSDGTGWLSFRWLCLLAAFIVGHVLYRTWFGTAGAVAGNAMVAALLPLTFTNSWGHPDHFMELFLFTLGCACIVRRWWVPFLLVLAAASFNRETSFLLVLVLLGAEVMSARHVKSVVTATVVWLTVYVGLRWRLGYVPYDPLQVTDNVSRLFSWPIQSAGRDLYYRLYAWFFLVLLAAPVPVIARTWASQPRFVRTSVGLVAPVFVAIGFTFSSLIEPRIFTPLIPLLATGVLFAVMTPDPEFRSAADLTDRGLQ